MSASPDASKVSERTSFDPKIILRPRSLDEIFDLALAYTRESFRDFARLYLLIGALGTVFVAIPWLVFALSPGAGFCLAVFVVVVLERIVTVYAGRHLFGNPATLKGALRTTAKRLPLLMTTLGFFYLPVMLIALGEFKDEVLVGFGLFLGTMWPFIAAAHIHLSEVALLEQLPAGKAGKRTRSLGARRFGRALGLMIVSGLIRLLFIAAAVFAFRFVLEFMLQFKGIPKEFKIITSFYGLLLTSPYFAMVRLFDYVDARTRREGWDIQVRFNAIAQRAKEDRLAA